MKYEPGLSLRGESAGSPEDWAKYATLGDAHQPSEVALFAATVYDICESIHIRAEIVMSLYTIATGRWHSYIWNARCNPYGGWCQKSAMEKNFGSGLRAGRAVMVNIWLLISGKELPAELFPYRNLDSLWLETIEAGKEGKIKTIEDLATHFGLNMDAVNDILNEELPFIIKE